MRQSYVIIPCGPTGRMAAENWASIALPVPRYLGHQAQHLTQQSAVNVSAPVTLQKSYRKRNITLSFQMKQISTSDRQWTGKMEAIGAENILWMSPESKDAVSVRKPMCCFVEVFKKKNLCIFLNGASTYCHKDVVQGRVPTQINEKGHSSRREMD